MMLSLGGLQFKNFHLEFSTHPKDLHRDYFWRRLNYGNQTHLNLSVIVGDDNKAQLRVALDRNDKPYFACDAGCLDPPLKLRFVAVQLRFGGGVPLTTHSIRSVARRACSRSS